MARQTANPEPGLQPEAAGLLTNCHHRGWVNDFLSES
jgi:hypothetical protein